MLHAILIDDEAADRADLRAKLAAHGVVVVGKAATVGAARALLVNADYEVVFLVPKPLGSARLPPALAASAGASQNFGEVALADHERVYLRQCLEAWEDTLPVAHVLRSGLLPRAVCYERDREPTRLFLAGAPVSRTRRWWRALRALLDS